MAKSAARTYIVEMEVTQMYRPPKPLEELAVNLLFKSHCESRYNRTPAEYQRLALLVTNLKDAYYRVNKGLNERHAAGSFEDAAICDFKAGDRYPHYRPIPTSISVQTISQWPNCSGIQRPEMAEALTG
jgi:hypothetical protein